jgi:hypothetical protein
MTRPKLTILRMMSRKIAVIILLAVSTAGAFATLGDGKKKSANSNQSLLSSRTANTPGYFSLRSGYTYRGSEVISNDKKYISLNTVVSMQRGKTTYILPLKKKVLLSNVKVELGNRQFRKN